MNRETTTTCGARHVTGVVCELPRGHAENHRGEDSHCSAQWPVERKPTTLELSGTMPDVSHYARCARCGGSGREEDASHTPAVSGEGDRLKKFREHLVNYQQGTKQRGTGAYSRGEIVGVQGTLAVLLGEFDQLFPEVRASTPTPGAPR